VTRAAHAVVRLVALPVIASAFVAWWLVGDLSEPDGEDTIMRLPFAERNAWQVGLIGLALGSVVATDAARNWRRGRGAAATAATAGALTAAGLRVVTARVVGANIGGGFVILAGPFVVVPLLAVAVAWAMAAAKT